jgi:carbamoyl-phosphate synthase/aspartate carbamoyltransferase
MVGYVESLTDPSYEGQILVLTFPLAGNYGVPSREEAESSIASLLASPFESSRIHVAGLVVAYYSHDFAHYLAASSLGAWLKEQGVPAIYGVDTRALTKRIRSSGSMLGKLLAARSTPAPANGVAADWRAEFDDVPYADPNARNLVAVVSSTQPRLYTPANTSAGGSLAPAGVAPLQHPSGRPLRILALDVGMKYNQIRCFTSRGAELKVVPWDHDFLAASEEPFDGLFISNGPGDPTSCAPTIARIAKLMERTGVAAIPIFGICLGHQLLALAAGAKTEKVRAAAGAASVGRH